MKDKNQKEERPEYFAIPVQLIACTPGNYDHANGEQNAIVTIARKDSIEPLIFNMNDARKLATRILVCLATHDDEHAQKLLNDNFPVDNRGDYHWPRSGMTD